jgi:hypothetical protein
MRMARSRIPFTLIQTAGCAKGGAAAAPTTDVLSTANSFPTIGVRPMEIPSPTTSIQTTGGAVRFDVFNPGAADGVGFALTTGPDSIWYESDVLPVAAGKTTELWFSFTAANYKTAATNWEFRASLADLDQVTRLSIIVYPNAAGSVTLDDLYLAAAS